MTDGSNDQDSAERYSDPPPGDRRPGGALALSVYAVDALLRRWYRIEDFTDDPDCLLRIAPKRACMSISLSDGAKIAPGQLVGELHCWNERVPRFPVEGPTLGWAKRAHRLVKHSLKLLAQHAQRDPVWRRAQAYSADLPISAEQTIASVRRMAAQYGFEPIPRQRTLWRVVHQITENMLLRALLYAYNPAAARRQGFWRRRQQIWISRSALIQRYAKETPSLSTLSRIDP